MYISEHEYIVCVCVCAYYMHMAENSFKVAQSGYYSTLFDS